jgi:hypothetical protein
MNSLRRLLRNVPVLRFGAPAVTAGVLIVASCPAPVSGIIQSNTMRLREKGARTAAKYGVKSEFDVDRIVHEFRRMRRYSPARSPVKRTSS